MSAYEDQKNLKEDRALGPVCDASYLVELYHLW